MQESQFGFKYSREDLQPIRPLYTTMVIVQVIGALVGFLVAPFPIFNLNVIAGAFAASFPGFLAGLLVQRFRDSTAIQDNRVMVRRIGLMALLFSLLVFVFPLLASCAAPMNRARDPGRPLAADEGIVIGSVLVRVGVAQDAPAPPVASIFLVPARSLRYSLESGPQRNTRSIVEKPIAGEMRQSLRIEPGKEEVFVTRMAAGPHVFFRLAPQGYEDAAAPLGIRFTVMPGTTTYIGRVILDLPEKLPLGSGLPRGLYSLKPGILIEDAGQATLDSIRNSRGGIVGNVATDLMRAN